MKFSRRSQLAVALYALAISLSLAMPLILVWMIYGLVWTSGAEFWTGYVPPGVWVCARVQVLQPLFVKLWWVRLLMITTANCVFMGWLYSVVKELRANGVQGRYAPHWAITGFFVPFLNFVRPYQVVCDAWRSLVGIEGGRTPASPWRIRLWWAFVFTNIAVEFCAGRASQPGFMELTTWALVLQTTNLVILASFIGVIALVEQLRCGERNEIKSPRSGRPRWTLAALGAAESLLITVLFTIAVRVYTDRQVHEVLVGGDVNFAQPFVSLPPRPAVSRPAVKAPADREGDSLNSLVGGVRGGVASEPASAEVPINHPTALRLGIAAANTLLLEGPPPEYPPAAREARIWGTVLLEVGINKQGQVTRVDAISGHPMLHEAAIDAVRHWKYRPPTLNGEAVDAVAVVSVSFNLEK